MEKVRENHGYDSDSQSTDYYGQAPLSHLPLEVSIEEDEEDSKSTLKKKKKSQNKQKTKKKKNYEKKHMVKSKNNRKNNSKISDKSNDGANMEKPKKKEKLSDNNEGADEVWLAPPIFQCDVCGRTFPRRRTLWIHKKTHLGRIKCESCDKEVLRDNMNRHLLTHKKVKDVECLYCDKKFTSKINLAHHMKRHSDDKPYLCHLCSKGFVTGSHLKQHILTHVEKTLPCGQCEKKFAAVKTLNYHRKYVHELMGIKPKITEKLFSCVLCERKFSRKTHLMDHIATHTGENTVNCLACEKSFSTKSSLARHLRKNSCKAISIIPIHFSSS